VRILYFADIRFPLERANGIQTMETCHALAARGNEVRLVVRPDTQSPARDPLEYYGLPPRKGLVVERAPSVGPQFARRVAYLSFALGRAMGAARADVVMTRDLGTAHLLAGVARTLRAPVVFESHGYAPDVAAAMPGLVSTATAPSARKLERLAAREAAVWRGAEGYVTITAALARTLVEKFGGRERVAVVPDGVRASAIGEWSPVPEHQPPVVGYAGHLYPWKGADVLLDAIARAPGMAALIAGGHEAEGDRARLEARAAALGISDRVEFTGHVAPSKVAEVLRRATILVLPNPASAISTDFTSPLKLFEYMAAGRPIVSSDLPAIREVLRHDVNALLVAPGDPGALAEGIRRLVTDRVLAARLARQALDDVKQYTWERRAERLEALFGEVRGGR
jgi:glycosyltransferase involved in cell wall biosynthesis